MFTNKEKEVAQLEKIIILIAQRATLPEIFTNFFCHKIPKMCFFHSAYHFCVLVCEKCRVTENKKCNHA